MSDESAGKPSRVHYLDTLKVAVVYGILVYHASLPFTYTTWLVNNQDKSLVLTAFAGFCFPWGIPLMFLLAGADAWFALRSRSAVAFLRARFLRLVLPLAAGIALLSPFQWYLSSVLTDRSLHGFLRSYPTFLGAMRLSWTPEWLSRYGYHLWFLGYLFAISAAVLPALLLLRWRGSSRVVAAAADLCRRPAALYLFALPLIASQIALRSRYPAYQDWADIATYTLVFLAGSVLASERRLEVAIKSGARLTLVVGSVSTLGVSVMLGLSGMGIRPANPVARDVAYSVLWAVMIWSWLLFFLNVGMRWLDFGNRVTAYLAESILPFYVLHHPVVVFVASMVIGLQLDVWTKFGLVVAISLCATLALYEFGVRRWVPTRFLFGLRTSSARAHGSAWRTPGPPSLEEPTALGL